MYIVYIVTARRTMYIYVYYVNAETVNEGTQAQESFAVNLQYTRSF